MREWLLMSALAGCTAHADRAAPRPRPASGPGASVADAPSVAPPLPPTAEPAADPGFIRGVSFALPIDHCVFDTGGPSCSVALREEKDATERRLMLRIVEARAAQAAQRLEATGQLEIPHPEQASFCQEKGPCGGKNSSGTPLDSAYACLTRASLALPTERAAFFHARACRCDPGVVELPIQGGTGLLGCDNGKAVRFGGTMSLAEAKDVEVCSQCDATEGPPACAREIERLRTTDPALSQHIREVHVPRCGRAQE